MNELDNEAKSCIAPLIATVYTKSISFESKQSLKQHLLSTNLVCWVKFKWMRFHGRKMVFSTERKFNGYHAVSVTNKMDLMAPSGN